MSKKIYKCDPCLQTFKGRPAYDEHLRYHRRITLPADRVKVERSKKAVEMPASPPALW